MEKKPSTQAAASIDPETYKAADDLQDYDTFFPEKNKSLLKKTMSKAIWDEYKDLKDASGVSFKICVFSGIKNPESGIGVYAGSHDAYKKFNKLFD